MPIGIVCIAIVVMVTADYMRPSKRAERQTSRQAEINRLTEERAQAEAQRLRNEAEAKRRAEERRKKSERDAVLTRYKNNTWRTQAEGYFFKGIKYGKGDGVFLNFEKSAQNFHIARNLAGPNEIAEMEKMIKHFSGEFLHKSWSASEYWDGYR